MGVRVLALLALLLVVPTAAAQPPATPSVELAVDAIAGRLMPEAERAAPLLRLGFSCSVDEATAAPDSEILVEFATGDVPAFATLHFNPGRADVRPDPTQCTDDGIRPRVNATVDLTLGRTAPAFVVQRVPLRATLTFMRIDGNETVRGPFETNLTFTPDYFSSFRLEADRQLATAGGSDRSASFLLRVTNDANGASRATFTVADVGGLNVTLPEPLELPASMPPATGEATLRVSVPDAVYRPDGVYTFRVEVVVSSTDPRANSTTEASLTMTVQAPPGAKRTPAVELGLWMPFALWFARRRPT